LLLLKAIADMFAVDVVLGRVDLLDEKFGLDDGGRKSVIDACKALILPCSAAPTNEALLQLSRVVKLDRGHKQFDAERDYNEDDVNAAVLVVESGAPPQPHVPVDVNAIYVVTVCPDKDEKAEGHDGLMLAFMLETKIDVRLRGDNLFTGEQVLQSRLLREAYASPSRSKVYCLTKKNKHGALIVRVTLK